MVKMRYFIAVIIWLCCQIAFADPIAVDQAFQFHARMGANNTVVMHWQIAPGYHLYRDRFCFKLIDPKKGLTTPIVLPPGLPREDNILGKYQVFNGALDIDIPVKDINANQVSFLVCYQGCSDNSFCYPPVTKKVTLQKLNIGQTVQATDASPVLPDTPPANQQDKITRLLAQGSFIWILLSFFGFGILLSLTPCVLPMYPILSGIIIGHGHKVSTRKAFFLSLTYVLGMAVTYAIAGVVAGLLGSSVQTALQNPWVISVFSVIFILLALSLFGFYELQLPSRWQEKLTAVSNHQKSGHYFGVAIMGVLATLIVSPCVTAPLIGALAYIGNSGNSFLGGSALFVMALGMGVPLLIIGTSHGSLLPRAGDWMNTVKSLFGVFMLAVAIWMLARIIPPVLVMFLWAGLLLISAIYLGVMAHPNSNWQKFWKGLGLIMVIYGVLLMIGGAIGNTNPLAPLSSFAQTQYVSNIKPTVFQPIKGLNALETKLAQAKSAGKITMLDFYADWCISCQEMAQKTFNNPQVSDALQNFNVLQADITNNDKVDKTLMQKFKVIAPPTILFFDVNGDEITDARIVGEVDAATFLADLQRVEDVQEAVAVDAQESAQVKEKPAATVAPTALMNAIQGH